MQRFLSVALVALIAGTAHAVVDPSTVCSGQPNKLPIWEGEGTPLRNSSRGFVVEMGPEDLAPRIKLVHVYGTPYEMGYGQGELLKTEITSLVAEVKQYFYSEIDQYLKFLPANFRHIVERVGVNAALEFTWALTKPFTPKHYIDEVQGIADATGLRFSEVMHTALIPELIQAACSMIGAWGPAVDRDDGRLLHLRALDWTTNGPFQKYPVVVAFHPAQGYGHPFSVVGWAGFVGAISGYSSANMGVSEKVWYAYKGSKPRAGYPFSFLMRDILQFDNDVDEALSRIASAHRTCSVFMGVGDDSDSFRGIGYSHDEVHFWKDDNCPAYGNHTRKEGLFYIDKHVQPSAHQCMPALMDTLYGKLSPQTLIQYVTAMEETGDMHAVVYDYAEHNMYVSNASPADDKGNCVPAYKRPFVKFDMDAIFAAKLQ